MINVALAAGGSGDTAKVLLEKATAAIVNPIITLFFIFSFAIFVFGIFEFIKSADDPSGRKKGQEHMIWGVVGFLIMVAVFSIIHLVMNTLGVTTETIWILP